MAEQKRSDIPEKKWSNDSWKNFPILQQPNYSDSQKVDDVEKQLKLFPGLVHEREVLRLREVLKDAEQGKRFVLQGGDCAERFQDCNPTIIQNKLKILLQMSLILIWIGKVPVVRIGRIAGQFSKPRSSPTEMLEGKEVLTFKGESINGLDPSDRAHDPERLIKTYFHSVATINHIRSLIAGGFSDLHEAGHWDLGYVKDQSNRSKYHDISTQLRNGLEFMDTCGIPENPALSSIDFFTSHEGLVLIYESALTREVKGLGHFNLGAHFLWIGDRTRQLDHAHVEYFRGIQNPIGIKVGPTSDRNEIIKVVRRVNPNNESGKIVLITRLTSTRVGELLPPLIELVKKEGLRVVWQCDPMHGNTVKTETGVKTRDFDTVLSELRQTFEIHQKCGSHLGGVHFELTGEDVTECTGGPQDLGEHNLSENYTSFCDPRFNYAQSMEMAFVMAPYLRDSRKESKKRNAEGAIDGNPAKQSKSIV